MLCVYSFMERKYGRLIKNHHFMHHTHTGLICMMNIKVMQLFPHLKKNYYSLVLSCIWLIPVIRQHFGFIIFGKNVMCNSMAKLLTSLLCWRQEFRASYWRMRWYRGLEIVSGGGRPKPLLCWVLILADPFCHERWGRGLKCRGNQGFLIIKWNKWRT